MILGIARCRCHQHTWRQAAPFCNTSHRKRRHPDFHIAEEFEKSLNTSSIQSATKFFHDMFVTISVSDERPVLQHVGSRLVLEQLKHPLLHRHGFDVLDFIAGARLAHERVLDCLYAADLPLQHNGHFRRGPSYELLEDVCSDEALDSFLEHAVSGHGGDDMFLVLSEKPTDDISIDCVKVILEERDEAAVLSPLVRVLADVSFVSAVQLEYAQQRPEEGLEKQRSQSPRVSQWQFSCVISTGLQEEGADDPAEERECEWTISRVLSHGGPFYE